MLNSHWHLATLGLESPDSRLSSRFICPWTNFIAKVLQVFDMFGMTSSGYWPSNTDEYGLEP